jgi:intracellular septation protein
MNDTTSSQPAASPQWRKMLLDFAPLVAFFVTYKIAGVYWATGVLIALTLLSLLVGYLQTGHIAKFPLFSAILISVMGGLTLYLHNDTFVKMKPTVANLIFAAILGGGLPMGRLFLKDLLGSSLDMPLSAWRSLTWRWVGFFIVLAVLNEYVWRNFSEGTWVNFKVFGLMGLTLGFILANAPFMARYMAQSLEKNKAPQTDE